jgi:hypothetical protein
MTPYRNKKLTNAAKGQECTLNIPGACVGGTETTVACHSPLWEDRNGTKAPDYAISFGCVACHSVIDRREKYYTHDGDNILVPMWITDDEQRFFFHRGMVRTLANLIERGIIKV